VTGKPLLAVPWRCGQCGIDCGGNGRYQSHLRFAHNIEVEVPVYKAVSPKFEPTLEEIVDRLATDRTLNDWQNFVPEQTVEMDGGAVLWVDAKTGAAKGVKLARFDLVPMDALIELAEHYGRGEAKYPSDPDGTPNWSKGYAWSKSTQAAMRHLAQFIGGEDLDAETSTKHVIAVAWHMFALAHYMNTQTGTDDRWQS
jgi:hypothetical protein